MSSTPVRDRILDFLINEGRLQTSEQILVAVMKVRQPAAAGADKILRAIIGDDPRFCFQGGAWGARAQAGESRYPRALALFIEQAGRGAGSLCLRGCLYRRDSDEYLDFELARSMKVPDAEALDRWQREMDGHPFVVWSGEMTRLWGLLLRACRLEREPGIVVCLHRLAARALPRAAKKIVPESLAADLGLPAPDADSPAHMARFIAACFEALVELVPEEHRFPAPALLSWIETSRTRADFSRFAFTKEDLRRLPASPGVYLMRNRDGGVIYVGKAGNLKRRVGSYFTSAALEDPKTARIHEQLFSLETVGTPSELDALMLETRMIRRHRPPVNLQIEVHERPAGYGMGLNLVFLAARPEDGIVRLHFMRDGTFAGRQSARLGRRATENLRTRIRKIYFPTGGHRKTRRETWEVRIASSWFARHRRQVNYVDIDDAGDFESAIRRLNSYLLDPDRLAKKVVYR